MSTGIVMVLLLAGANVADESCEFSCAEPPKQYGDLREKPRLSSAGCGTMTLQFKVGGRARENQQNVCEIRIEQR